MPKLLLINDCHSQLPGFVQLRPRIRSCKNVARLLTDRRTDLAAALLNHLGRFFTGKTFERPRQNESLSGERLWDPRLIRGFGLHVQASHSEPFDQLQVVVFVEKPIDAFRQLGANLVNLLQLGLLGCFEIVH